jgi:hypothetical protein
MLTKDILEKPKYLRMTLGELDHLPYAIRPPSPNRTRKIGTAAQPSTSHRSISRCTQRIAAELWGWMGYLVDNLSLEVYPPKRSQSWVIANLVPHLQELGLHQKPPNQRPSREFVGTRSPRE